MYVTATMTITTTANTTISCTKLLKSDNPGTTFYENVSHLAGLGLNPNLAR
jgi:hypothetical protein